MSRPKVAFIGTGGTMASLGETPLTLMDYGGPGRIMQASAILARFPDFDRKNLRIALRMHTASTKYLKAVERGGERFDLDGKASGEVTDEQRQHAATTLKERFAAVAKQQREKREADEAERRRTEKLQQLVSKFGR